MKKLLLLIIASIFIFSACGEEEEDLVINGKIYHQIDGDGVANMMHAYTFSEKTYHKITTITLIGEKKPSYIEEKGTYRLIYPGISFFCDSIKTVSIDELSGEYKYKGNSYSGKFSSHYKFKIDNIEYITE